MRPRGSPPDRDVCGTKLRHRCCEHPQGGSFTVVGSGRIGIFRCQPVVDTYTGQLRAIRDRFEPRILEIRAAHEPAAAMEMEVDALRSEEHTSELQSLMRIAYAVFCLKQKITNNRFKYTTLILI